MSRVFISILNQVVVEKRRYGTKRGIEKYYKTDFDRRAKEGGFINFKAETEAGAKEQFKHTVEVFKNLVDAIEALEAGENESATNYANYMKQGKLLFFRR